MSVSLTQSANGFTSSGTSATVILNTATIADGDLIVVDIDWGSNTGSFVVSDDHNAGNYTSHPDGPKTQGNQCHMFWHLNSGAVSSVTVTVSITGGGSHTIRCAAFDYNSTTGFNTTPLDQHSSNAVTASITMPSGSNIIPAAAGELVHACIQYSTAVSAINCTAPYGEQHAGGTNGWHSDGRATSGDNPNCASGAQTCTFNWTTNADASTLIAAFLNGTGGTVIVYEDDSIPQFQPPMVEPIISVW